ncbi:phosphatidate cytidylyltransferase [Roseovarius aestuariivivens]|uniref:phosphatidate cytidylyltransferase n=1 Tax=Roseovarius aestuariivivens TaxID=1888910 RepID=UPI0010819F33|nr:phosphatidate cytidylyltransferase [Roseovarius aestuariivivens]
MSAAARWHDLAPRVYSGIAMAVFGLFAVWMGGPLFALLSAAICGLMAWETARMFRAGQAVGLGVLAGVVLLLAGWAPGVLALPLLLAPGFVAAGQVPRDRLMLFGMTAWVMLASFALIWLRSEEGKLWLAWLIAVVIASDVMGYFAGRMLGGPKFWPRLSPKKTWSGTVAGWALAAVIGAAFAGPLGADPWLIVVSVLVGFAGQMGDIFESAVKRRQGVKDSSSLIPGHGGVFDRFDALLGASAVTLLLWALGLLPGTGG